MTTTAVPTQPPSPPHPPPATRSGTSPRSAGPGPTGCWSARRSPSSPTNGCSPRTPWPAPTTGSGTRSAATTARSTYRFAARLLALDHWQIDADSITRHRDGTSTATWTRWTSSSSCATPSGSPRRDPPGLPGGDHLHAGRHRVQAGPGRAERRRAGRRRTSRPSRPAMTEGHPCFVANNGRLGFGVDEYHRYAPEAAAPGAAGLAGRAPRPLDVQQRAPTSTTTR